MPSPRAATRREQREQQRRQRRRRRLTVLAVVLAALLVAGGAYLAVSATGGGHRSAASTGRTQTTLLVQLRRPGGAALESMLLAHDRRTHNGVEVLVPSQVIAEVPGFGSQDFGKALQLPNGAAVSRSTLEDLMDVLVDGSWVLTTDTLSTLVDRLGGVQVNVDTQVTAPVRGGGTAVLLNPGRQLLTGQQAVRYATYLAPGEAPTANLPRLQAVFDGIFAALPHTSTQVSALIGSLGGGSTASMSPAQLATLLTGLAADYQANAIAYTTLPVLPIDTGAGTVYRIDAANVHALVLTDLANSIPPGGLATGNRVLVENGVGTPGLGATARDRLQSAGLQFVGSQNADHFGYTQSVVLIFQDTPQATAVGTRVARALGLSPNEVRFSPLTQTVADVIVILGGDYRP